MFPREHIVGTELYRQYCTDRQVPESKWIVEVAGAAVHSSLIFDASTERIPKMGRFQNGNVPAALPSIRWKGRTVEVGAGGQPLTARRYAKSFMLTPRPR